VLKVLGYDVATAKSGSEAVEVFSGTPEGIDLVISDMTMPGMTGLELAEKLLGIRSDIPVILCTGLSDSVNSQHARDTGIRELLEKPADIDDLAGAINRALEREKSPDV
ncbi:MAG TPA: response regulator, partial [Deltaproteobacteria bacterium]|nr:response regulator [Deltaproteobacteria bacterium]